MSFLGVYMVGIIYILVCKTLLSYAELVIDKNIETDWVLQNILKITSYNRCW